MINEMMAAGMLLLGTVDYLSDGHARIEYKLGQTYQWIDVSLKQSECKPLEGMTVLFSKDAVVKCFCSEAPAQRGI